MVSMLRPWGFFVKEEAGLLNISEYKNRYGFPATTEFDTRFHNKADIPIGKEGFGYSNILDEEMDFIGKYENLEEDTRFIFKSINLNKKFIFNKTPKPYDSVNYQSYYNDKTREEVEYMYKHDIVKYNYEF